MSTPQAVRLVGGVVPPALIPRLQAGEVGDRASLSPSSYHLVGTETVRDAASRAWGYLRGAWTAWRTIDQARTPNTPGTGPARDRWLLPLLRELGYGQVPTLPSGLHVDDRNYPVSHQWSYVPIHLLGPGVELDRRNTGVTGAARAPQAMLQELLNRSNAHLWALLSNGLRLRLLRDSTALAGSAYVEFDLEAIFDGELYADWLLLFQLCHVSRVEPRSGPEAPPSDCWLERWRGEAVDAGARALDRLRDGVESALMALGTGFLRHPGNGWLRAALQAGEITDRDYHRALLRLVYRLLFVFVAEDRDAFLDPAAEPLAKQRYSRFFSTTRLRRLSRVRAGVAHPDLWRAQRMVLRAAGGKGAPAIAVPALGGLFDADPRAIILSALRSAENGEDSDHSNPADLLDAAELTNADLLSAVRSLAWVQVKGQRVQPVDYRHLGAEELGSVYESLLELIPRLDLAQHQFILERLAGNERKTTGSYYTPPALVSALLDTALDPLLDDATKNAANAADAEERLLALTICDPACGSGGFLVAAARRVARRLAQVRSGEDEPTPADVQHALRDVVGRCVYGVDLNDLAAELAKVSLWLEALEPGKPLGFLDARIRVGNALLGTTPALLEAGIPDDAFKELDGDDKAFARTIRKRNAQERAGWIPFSFEGDAEDPSSLAQQRLAILTSVDDIAQVRAQSQAWATYEQSQALRQERTCADAWSAAFVWPLAHSAPPPPTVGVLQQLKDAGVNASGVAVTVAEVERLREACRFFHWHIEFPEIFADSKAKDEGREGWTGGFSCLVGNPPWERVKLQEQEYFAGRDPAIAQAPNAAARRKLISVLNEDDPSLYKAFLDEKRRIDGQSKMLRTSGRFPLNGRGDVNTYAVFAELFRSLTGPRGRAGVIVPTGIATDATTQYFFKDLVENASLSALYDFENRAPLFVDVDSRFKFCLLTMAGRDQREDAASFAFFLHDPSEIAISTFALTPAEILLLNPNTGTCPVFRTRRDAEITLGIYRRIPILVKEGDPNGNPWSISFMTMFHMSGDSHLFRTREQLKADEWLLQGNVFTRAHGGDEDIMLPLYQGMMASFFNHRAADVIRSDKALQRQNQPRYLTDQELDDPMRVVQPGYWVASREVPEGLPTWLLAFSNVSSPTNERSMIAYAIPRTPVGHSTPLIFGNAVYTLLAILSSFVFDYVLRQKLGGVNLTYNYVKQLPVLAPDSVESTVQWLSQPASRWVEGYLLELSFTSYDMSAFAHGLADEGQPFRWDAERRFLLRAELDAAFFHLYGVDRPDVEYILDTFWIVKRKDIAAHGDYRTRRRILEMYDAMQRAIDTGAPYQTLLDPPPGQGPRHTTEGVSS